jgi:fructose/tagatose bisphosphate aldolase
MAWVENALRAGFNLVMWADAQLNYSDLTRGVSNLVRLAHQRSVAVEAELGVLPAGVADHGDPGGSPTDPDLAADFVRETGVDVLAVSVGNVHVLMHGQRELDLARIAAISQKVDIPLALHGGTGIGADSLRQAVALGVAKVNYGTYLKQRTLAAWRQEFIGPGDSPHRTLGDGGDRDLMVIGRRAVRDAVLERIGILGCCGRA